MADANKQRHGDEPDALAREPVAAPQHVARPVHCGSLMAQPEGTSRALGQPGLNGVLRGKRATPEMPQM